ncbi:MAG: hypothetical protein DME99_08760 [Verrucomicrobia bacterium]|nr:MAG: hypothetical protein DME99_08760 [Verrucomicrobiota bacterium]
MTKMPWRHSIPNTRRRSKTTISPSWIVSWPILADDFALVTGLGKTYTKTDLLNEARSKRTVYEHQEDSAQKVRVWGDTAVVTALLWAKGTEEGKPFDYKLWFSDTYVRTPAGWRYVFGQASTRLPKAP